MSYHSNGTNRIEVLPSDDPKKIRLGWYIQEPAILFLNDCSIKISFSEKSYPIKKYNDVYFDRRRRFEILDL